LEFLYSHFLALSNIIGILPLTLSIVLFGESAKMKLVFIEIHVICALLSHPHVCKWSVPFYHNISAGLHSMRYWVVLSMFQNCTSALSAAFYAAVRFGTDACITFLCSVNYFLVQPELHCCPSTSCAFVCKHFYSTKSSVSLTSL